MRADATGEKIGTSFSACSMFINLPDRRLLAMKFFIDTADLAEIRALAATGLVDGVTTNPSLIAKSGRGFLDAIAEICSIVGGPVSAEVTATHSESMVKEGRK